MRKGKVKCLNIGHKNGNKILYAGDVVIEADVADFDKLVKSGHIAEDKQKKATKKAE